MLRGRRFWKSGPILGVLAAVALSAAPAEANTSHAYEGSIGVASSVPPNPFPSDPYPLSEPTDVEIDQATHDIYVTDPGNHRIEKFDSTGHLLLMFGKEVNKTKTDGHADPIEENLCTVASGDTCQTGAASNTSGGFETPEYLAVDNTGSQSKGDIYVADIGDGLVQKFNASGELVRSWGVNGQKDGSDDNVFHTFATPWGLAVGGSDGSLFVGVGLNQLVDEYSESGTYLGTPAGAGFYAGGDRWIKADPTGNLFFEQANGFLSLTVLAEHSPLTSHPLSPGPVEGFALDPSSQEIYQDTGAAIQHYGADCITATSGPCSPADAFGGAQLSNPQGVAVDGASHAVYVANTASNNVAVFDDVRPIVTTGSPSNVTESEVTLTAHIDPAGRGAITECRFEYGFDNSYGKSVPCSPDPASNPPSSNFNGPTDVTATFTGLSPGTREHYRVVATNTAGATSEGLDESFITTQPPAVDGLSSANLTATTADLNAQLNPNGLETSYHFEYGTTVSYGQSKPVPDSDLSAGNSDQSVSVHLEGLTPHAVYHYRLLATNADGTTVSEDHTFNFYPPSCPNENVRQQTQANYLPDCRAYELVTPSNAEGTQITPVGPNTGYATSPSRLSFSGRFSTIAEAGGSPIDGENPDLYVATRTYTGWVSRYVGLPSSAAPLDGGPPMGPPNSNPSPILRGVTAIDGSAGILTDMSMDKFAVFNEGPIGDGDKTVIGSNAPYIRNSDGNLLDRWPTNLATVPAGSYQEGFIDSSGESVSLGGLHALDCPAIHENVSFHLLVANYCPGDVTASADFSHFVFATEWNVFAPGGQVSPPGSVYDNDTKSGSVVVASKTPDGDDIPSEPTDGAGDPLQIPAVSADGSHILMAAGGVGPCGEAGCPIPPCGTYSGYVRRCPMQPSHLYMRVDGAVTFDVSQGHDVTYVGETSDGSKVYFTTDQQLTSEDTDSSTDLYMWSEAGAESGHPLTLISKGSSGQGNSDNCTASFVTGCGVTTFNQLYYCGLSNSAGGNCLSDSFIAAKSGDIYFFSPEQLDGTLGLANKQNLYVYHDGQVQYVTTLTGAPYCYTRERLDEEQCTRVVRMQVSADGNHMAFITNSQLTQYDNAGYLEMYTYDPNSRGVACVSCNPDGEPPTSNVLASQDGLFLTNDGRTFFSTEDALVHGDTNRAVDVYEYVGGRPQLITPGTGETSQPGSVADGPKIAASVGLVGVSADGVDVYFGTYQTLVPSDHNGLFYKIYDARSGGGFPAPSPQPPCDAADECHGAGSAAPPPLRNGSGTALGSGGNVSEGHKKRSRRHARQAHKRHRHRSARKPGRGGSR